MTRRATLFFRTALSRIGQTASSLVDIGGALRILSSKGNRYDPRNEWMQSLLSTVKYQVMDPVPDYHPDILGDIHALPFQDNSQDAIVCVSVLEHVEDPRKACEELYRVLKPGGMLLGYVPFLYYYHAEPGYYKDYWRFTADTLQILFPKHSEFVVENVRGAIETWFNLLPFGRSPLLSLSSRWLDRILGKFNSRQTSGLNFFLVK